MSLSNTSVFTASLTISGTFQTLASLLIANGLPEAAQDAQLESPCFIRNQDVSIVIYVASGYSTIPTGSICPIDPQDTIELVAGLNLNEIWVKSASGTPIISFAIGSTGYNITKLTGISTVSGTTNILSKFDASDDLVDSSITDDGAGAVTIASDVSVTGTVTSADATTPYFETASGSTNTGYVNIKGKTSGAMKFLPADATAQTVTIATAAQTVGATTLTIPNQANVSSNFVFDTLAQTLTNKTMTAPALNSPVITTGTITTSLLPTTNDGAPLGSTTLGFSDLFLATGAVLNYANGNVAVTHTSGILTMGTGDFRVTTAGTNTASVVTVGGTQTLAAKTLTTPVIGVATGTSLAVTGLITTASPTAAFGFATGAGGAQTQATDKSTTVASNTNTTAITMNAANLAAATIVAFTFTNSAIAATDQVIVTHQSAGTAGAYTFAAFPSAGSAVVSVRNNTAGGLAEAIVLRVSILKAVSA